MQLHVLCNYGFSPNTFVSYVIMDPPQTSEDTASFNLDSFIKGYHVYQEVWSPELLEELNAVPEPSKILDKYAVSVELGGEVVGRLMKGKSGHFAKTIFLFFVCR